MADLLSLIAWPNKLDFEKVQEWHEREIVALKTENAKLRQALREAKWDIEQGVSPQTAMSLIDKALGETE